MSTTLYDHPPQPVAELAPPRPHARPTVLERLSLRVGLWLVTYGRRSYAKAPRKPAARTPEYDALVRDLSWSRAQRPMGPLV
jgi:hypothetical protein